ncbi:MAG: hypothetical protein QOI24_2337 [Acidobacteriota bacterium]|nr:hypothetical protein [Acidobacteriota bacterium]
MWPPSAVVNTLTYGSPFAAATSVRDDASPRTGSSGAVMISSGRRMAVSRVDGSAAAMNASTDDGGVPAGQCARRYVRYAVNGA